MKQKPSGARPTPVRTPAGPADHHIPMTVKLLGPVGCNVILVDTQDPGGGDITISPSTVSLAGGAQTEVTIYGVSASDALEDVKIQATTNLTGSLVCEEEDLTVIWIEYGDMFFRGSGHQGQGLTPGSTALFTDVDSWRYNLVGKFIYPKEVTHSGGAAARWQMEIKYRPSPNVVMPGLEWDIKREISRVAWLPGLDPRIKKVVGATGWYPDDGDDTDEDLIQNSPYPTEIFERDGPGYGTRSKGLAYTAGYKFTYKAKFQDWVEVKVGTKWYVCSEYKPWRCIMHVKYQDSTAGWVEDTSYTNEIVAGDIPGWAGSWSEY